VLASRDIGPTITTKLLGQKAMNISPQVAEIVGGIDFDPAALHACYMAERDRRARADGNGQSMLDAGRDEGSLCGLEFL
jgi:hypothetical protein